MLAIVKYRTPRVGIERVENMCQHSSWAMGGKLSWRKKHRMKDGMSEIDGIYCCTHQEDVIDDAYNDARLSKPEFGLLFLLAGRRFATSA